MHIQRERAHVRRNQLIAGSPIYDRFREDLEINGLVRTWACASIIRAEGYSATEIKHKLAESGVELVGVDESYGWCAEFCGLYVKEGRDKCAFDSLFE